MRTQRPGFVALVAGSLLATAIAFAGSVNDFNQLNLVSDIPGTASYTDPTLINPWGVAFSAGSPIWVSDNGTGLAGIYNGLGGTVIPPRGTVSLGPTGQVFNTATYTGLDGTTTPHFIFASEDGIISGWSGGTTAATMYNDAGSGAVFKGLGTSTIGSNSYLYATDFWNGKIDVFGSNGAPSLTGTFTDPSLPAGYYPFNVQNIGGQLFVTYAQHSTDCMANSCDDNGMGGIVDVYDLQGNFVARVASGGPLASPWGLALAPSGFGPFGGDLLVGNFGSGMIDAFSLSNSFVGTFAGTLDGTGGTPITNSGLWSLAFGNGAQDTSTGSLYITAGLNHEADGLFAALDPVPEPGTWALAGLGLLSIIRLRRRRA